MSENWRYWWTGRASSGPSPYDHEEVEIMQDGDPASATRIKLREMPPEMNVANLLWRSVSAEKKETAE